MQTGYCKEMQKTHTGKAVPGIAVQLPPVSKKERMEDRSRLRIGQKPIQAGLNEGSGRFKQTPCTPPVTSCPFHTPLHEIETSIDALAEQIAPVVELTRISGTRQWSKTPLQYYLITPCRQPIALPVTSGSEPAGH